MQKITTFLWFDDQAEEAVKFYTSIFKNSRIKEVSTMNDARPDVDAKVLVATFELDGQEFMAMNGGPMFKFTPAISLSVNCENQDEIDYYWDRLSEGGQKVECGWITDKYGLSWQVIPSILGKLMSDKDHSKSKRVMEALMKMKKLDIATLQKAYDGI